MNIVLRDFGAADSSASVSRVLVALGRTRLKLV